MDFLPLWASLMAQKCKESACNAEDTGDIVLILGLRRSPGVGLTPVVLLGKLHRQRSSEGCSPKVCKESDMTT